MKILDTIYFNNVGIVLVDNGYEVKSYIKSFTGLDEYDAPKYIADWGNTFPLQSALSLFPSYNTIIQAQIDKIC